MVLIISKCNPLIYMEIIPFEFILSDNGEKKGGNFGEYVKVLRLLKMVKLLDGFVSNVLLYYQHICVHAYDIILVVIHIQNMIHHGLKAKE